MVLSRLFTTDFRLSTEQLFGLIDDVGVVVDDKDKSRGESEDKIMLKEIIFVKLAI